jgi:hypothetical protein
MTRERALIGWLVLMTRFALLQLLMVLFGAP